MINLTLIKGQESYDFKVNINKGCGIHVMYGINSHYYDAGDNTERYRLHSSIIPREGDKIYHKKSNRTFVIGKFEGFLIYTAPLLENGVQVSTITYEDYYKD